MITIIRYKQESVPITPGENIAGWIIATDVHDARRKAYGAMQNDLAEALYRMEFDPRPGKYDIGNNMIMLVS